MRVTRQLVLWGVVSAALVVSSCGSGGGSDSDSANQLGFSVVDSLLGPPFTVARAGQQFSPPAGFVQASDSLLTVMRAQLQASLGQETGVELVGCFLDSALPLGLVVSVIDTLNLSADTGSYFHRYGGSLRAVFGENQVREGEYRVHDIFVKNFLVTDSINVRFQLLCLAKSGNAMELTYFAPRLLYPKYVRYFESSIGSLQLTKQGG